jgi:5-methylcytosine-specific restriction protein B
MTEKDLGKILKEMHDKAEEGFESTNILLFGIEFAQIILKQNYKPTSIVRASGLHPSYSIELRKGVKLSKFVRPI